MKSIVLSLLFVFSSSVMAAGYGDAGCGLGSMVLGSDPGFTQVFAATTNGTFGSQTFGITSGTSNCSKGSKAATEFIEANKTGLKNDAARGNGETLASLAEIYGINNTQCFGQTVQKHFSTIFQSENSEEINARIQILASCQA